MVNELTANGDRGEKSIMVEADVETLRSCGPYAEGASASFDWYNDKLQILVFDRQDDPALHVRYNQDGTIAEIVVRDREMLRLMVAENEPREVSNWQKERDGDTPMP